MTLWIGIAPGAKGAIVMLGQCGDPLLIQTPKPDPLLYSKALVACLEVAAHQHEGRIAAAVEPPEACRVFNDAERSAGWWEGALAGAHIPFRTLTPLLWQSTLDGDEGSVRERSLATARRLFPKLDLKADDEGVATALHVAVWVRSQNAGATRSPPRHEPRNACTGFGVPGGDEFDGI